MASTGRPSRPSLAFAAGVAVLAICAPLSRWFGWTASPRNLAEDRCARAIARAATATIWLVPVQMLWIGLPTRAWEGLWIGLPTRAWEGRVGNVRVAGWVGRVIRGGIGNYDEYPHH